MTAYRNSFEAADICEDETTEEDQVWEVGGGDPGQTEFVDPYEGYTYCMVRVRYYTDTGEIIDYTVLYCW